MPKILTIAGFDPSGGAGVLADVKTFERLRICGMAVVTANTVQDEKNFYSVNWVDERLVVEQLEKLLLTHEFSVVKIGLVPSLSFILKLLKFFPNNPVFVWDPVLSSSTGFDFKYELSLLTDVLKQVNFVTPNWEEVKVLSGNEDALDGAKELAKYCNVYLKGGHNSKDVGRDYLLIEKGKSYSFKKQGIHVSPKHGSGCVFSSALAAQIALGFKSHKACLKAKSYVTKFMESNKSLLGNHVR